MVRRRDIPAALIAAAAQGSMLPQRAHADAEAVPEYPATREESDAGLKALRSGYPPGNVLRYGADPSGGADSSLAFQSACNSGAGRVAVPPGTYRIGSTVSMNIAATSLQGDGATVISAVAKGDVLAIYSTGGAEACSKHDVSGVAFVGKNAPGVRAVRVAAPKPYMAAGFAFRSCTFTAFDEFVRIETNAFCINFVACTFTQGGASGGVRVPAGGSNYGERISFTSCFFANNAICLRSDYSSVQFHLVNCSLDYSYRLIVMNGGLAQVNNCYIESDLDTAPWFFTGGGEASINLTNCTIAQTGPKPDHEIARSASATGSLDFRNCLFYSGTDVVRPTIVGGDGSAYGSGNRVIGFKNNRRAWGALSNRASLAPAMTAGLAGWVHGSHGAGGHPSVITDESLGGLGVLVFRVAVDGEDQYAYYPVRCEPGDNVGIVYQAKATDAGAPFECVLDACDGGGTLIATLEPELGFSAWDGKVHSLSSSYRTCRNCFVNVPRGTAVCRVGFRARGQTRVNHRVFVGDILIGKY